MLMEWLLLDHGVPIFVGVHFLLNLKSSLNLVLSSLSNPWLITLFIDTMPVDLLMIGIVHIRRKSCFWYMKMLS